MARSRKPDQPDDRDSPAARRRRRREWRRAFRILTLGAGALSILLGVGVAPDVMYRDGNPVSALLIVLLPLLIVGGARLVYGLVTGRRR